MIRNVGSHLGSVHLPLELLAASNSRRFFAVPASPSSFPQRFVRSNKPRPSASVAAKPTRSSPSLATKSDKPQEGRAKRLLEPHVLSQRLRTLCEDGKLDVAVDMLKTSPMDAQSTPVWNTLIWEAFKAERWNLAYKLFTDMKRRGLSPTTRTYETMFSGLSRLDQWETHPLQLDNAHKLYAYFLEHLKAAKFHKLPAEELTITPLAKYIKILGDCGDVQKIFDVYYAMDTEGLLAPNQDIFTSMFQVLAGQKTGSGNESTTFQNQSSSTAKLLWIQLEKASRKSPGFEIDSHLLAMAIKALGRGRPADQEFALDLVRDRLGLAKSGEPVKTTPTALLNSHTLAAALDVCHEMKKPKLVVEYLLQIMHPRVTKDARKGERILDRGHIEQGLRAYASQAQVGISGQSLYALEMLRWMLKAEITQSNDQLRPRLMTYSFVLSACRSAGDWSCATKAFEMMTGYKAIDFTDLRNTGGLPPEKDKRSRGRNLAPDAEVMSSMVRTAIATHNPANIRQALRMVDFFGLEKLLNKATLKREEGGLSNKSKRVGAFFHEKLAAALKDAVVLLQRDNKNADGLNGDSETALWRSLQDRAKEYLADVPKRDYAISQSAFGGVERSAGARRADTRPTGMPLRASPRPSKVLEYVQGRSTSESDDGFVHVRQRLRA